MLLASRSLSRFLGSKRAFSVSVKEVYAATKDDRPVRVLTAVAAYDGHDASILAVNRALLAQGQNIELIYQGFNRSIHQLTLAACQEGVDVVALSTYNGGHRQFIPALVDSLKKAGSQAIVVAGGGGTITPDDAAYIESQGVKKVYGIEWGLHELAADVVNLGRAVERNGTVEEVVAAAEKGNDAAIGEMLNLAELYAFMSKKHSHLPIVSQLGHALKGKKKKGKTVFVVGDGGSGKSTLSDALVAKFSREFGESRRVAVVAVDPTTTQEGRLSTLLGDRVRMNSIYDSSCFMRSVATREPYEGFPKSMKALIPYLSSQFDLTVIESPGSGQVGFDLRSYEPDVILYVKTKEFGSANIQLLKDQMLKDADLVVLNKADREGSRTAFEQISGMLENQDRHPPSKAFAAIAKMPRDAGTNNVYHHLMKTLGFPTNATVDAADPFTPQASYILVPHSRRNYIGRVVDSVRSYDKFCDDQLAALKRGGRASLHPKAQNLLETYNERWNKLTKNQDTTYNSYNGLKVPKVAFPDPADEYETLRFLLEDGLPGEFPFTNGCFPLRREAMETTRQFAGLRLAEHTNERFHLLAQGVAAPRLSTAFDGVTLYGADSDDDPGALGKVGEGGVAVDSLADMRILYGGFDFEKISTSMTINGPATQILAMYFNAAAEWAIERYKENRPAEVHPSKGAEYRASPEELDGLAGDDVHPEYGLKVSVVNEIRTSTWRALRGTVQADILKEVQAQNECLFSMDFSIKLMGDVQKFFFENKITKFYSVSISGYHIGEAGATPAQELAFTLANGFTYLENLIGRGLDVNAAAGNFSWFFRNSHELEWLAAGPISRKIWAVSLRDIYGADSKAQMLKFHTQTSGRALQVAEWDTLNPVRQTLHALIGLLNNSNSLHVDSADEATNTPSEKYVRQATMIPNILSFEAETLQLQNLLSGSYGMRHIKRETQEHILKELELIDAEGGVPPATEMGFHRGRIAASSNNYEMDIWNKKRIIIGRNMLPLPVQEYPPANLVRPTADDWNIQLARTNKFRHKNATVSAKWLKRLEEVSLNGGNVFAELLNTTRYATLGETSKIFYRTGGRFSQPV